MLSKPVPLTPTNQPFKFQAEGGWPGYSLGVRMAIQDTPWVKFVLIMDWNGLHDLTITSGSGAYWSTAPDPHNVIIIYLG